MNTDLLRHVRDHVRDEPWDLDMGTWSIMGWALRVSGVPVPHAPDTLAKDAAALLDIPLQDAEDCFLFYVSQWPEPWRTRYLDAEEEHFANHALLCPALAQVTADYLDFVIAREEARVRQVPLPGSKA